MEAGSKNEHFTISHVVHLAASEETVRSRLQARGRLDDKAEVVEERFKEYRELTRPLIDWFKEHGIDVIEINAEHSVDDVNSDVTQSLQL